MGSHEKESSISRDNCLICSSLESCSSNNLVKVLDPHADEDLTSKQLQVIFLFRKILDIPSKILAGYLCSWGNPDGWISLCSNCHGLVQDARQIHEKILELCKKFTLLKENIRDKLKESCHRHHQRIQKSSRTRRNIKRDNASSSSIITAETHGIVCGKKCPLLESPHIGEEKEPDHEEMIIKVEVNETSEHEVAELPALDMPAVATNYCNNDDANFGNDDEYFPSVFCGSENEAAQSDVLSDDDYLPKPLRKYTKRKSKGKVKPPFKTAFSVDEQNCDICKKWIKLTEMKEHLKNHLGRSGWCCEACQKAFPSRTVFLMHLGKRLKCRDNPRSQAELHEINICKSCNPEQYFATEVDLFNHVFSVHEKDQAVEKNHECKICTLRYRTDHGLDFHFNKHIHNGRMWLRKGPARDLRPSTDKGVLERCEVCKKRVPKEYMADHSKRHDHNGGDSVSCKLCSRIFSDREAYLQHLMKSHKSEEKPCDICWSVNGVIEEFRHVYQLRGHLYNIHDVGSRLSCPTCNKIFHTEEALVGHIKLKHGDKSEKVSCEMCIKSGDPHGAYFSCQKTFERHLRKSHKPDQIKCERCPAQFPCKYDFMQHEINFHKLDPFMCSVCKKEFVHAAAFKRHMPRHILPTSERNPKYSVIKCSKCHKTFTNKKLLDQHFVVHEEAQFKCQFCEKVYKEKRCLQNHEALHLPGGRPRPFVCEVCGFGFHMKNLLTQHKTKHTGEKPFVCQLCGDKFRQKKTLLQHQRGKHRDIFKKETATK